jgi:hypothetical protein
MYLLIIAGLCYVIYYREKTTRDDYIVLSNRCDTVSYYYQKKIELLQEKRQIDLQGFNDKMENLYKENEKIKNKIK